MTRTTLNAETDERMRIGLSLTLPQLCEINQRADLGPFDGKARSEYIVGCLFGEMHEELLRRVRAVRDAERARFRAEVEAEHAQRAQRDSQRRR